ncbi:MAG TPA: RcpC/CpaB family pilus assembly protein [Humibacter sp.]|nr:RcpC/CpaB family pilus assembly protein [Humibacter sp.]
MIRIIGAIVAVILAVGGGLALFLYTQGADARAAAGQTLQSVYVLTDDIPKGTTGAAVKDHLQIERLPRIAIQPDIVTDLTSVSGLVANADLLKGDQLVKPRFSDPKSLAASTGAVPVPKGMQQVTIPLVVDRVVGGAVQAGSTVGIVYSTHTSTSAATTNIAVTQFIYHRVLVTRVTPGLTYQAPSSTTAPSSSNSTASSSPSQGASTMMVTLAVTAAQAEKLVYTAEQQQSGNGGIWLTLETSDSSTAGSTPRDGGNVFK